VTVTTYPSAVDYTLALQNPTAAFADASLRTATFAQGLLGPYGIAGSSAVVFHAMVGTEEYALRCYTRQDASTPERYAALDSFVSAHALSKHVGIVTWYQDQVHVKGARWPVLKMEWIAGQQLNEYVGYLADNRNTAALRTLAERWLVLIGELQRVGFAHGDLQHGNILVDQQGQLRLVDFDSVWIPALQGQEPPTESGHPSYQSHGATPRSRWGPFMDTFSGLVIYLALTALARDPGLWPKFNNGDNLLFERADFVPSLDTEIWKSLAGLGDAEVDRVVGKLKECFAPGWTASKSLRDTLRSAWWEQQGAAMKTVTLGTATEGTPAAGAGAQTLPQAPPWYAPSVPSQATPPAGSLPPPLTAGYQSAVAPQATGPLPTATGEAGAAKGDQSWWGGKQQPKTTEPKPKTAPAKAKSTKPAKQNGNPVRSALGALLMLGGIIVFLVLTTHHDAGVGAAVGAVMFFVGIGVADTRSSKRKPPGTPPAPPASSGGAGGAGTAGGAPGGTPGGT